MFEDVNLLHCLVLIGAGIFAGFFNVFAGGGSLITLPVLMDYIGLSGAVANGTNRLGVLALNASAIAGFQSKGYKVERYTIILGCIALVFSILGALISIQIPDDLFKKILAGVMIMAIVATILKPMITKNNSVERLTERSKIFGYIAFAAVGFYGGFIQAGVGFVIISFLSIIHNLNLVKINSMKVAIVGIYSLAAISVFIISGNFNVFYGLIIAIGTVLGAFFGARVNASIDEKYVKIVFVFVLAFMAYVQFSKM